MLWRRIYSRNSEQEVLFECVQKVCKKREEAVRMTVLMDILEVLAWCFAVYVCAFDWEDARDEETEETTDEGD